MAFSKSAPIQLHYQLANELRNYIQSGSWNIGDLFPTDREIMEKYKVSATTVRRAVNQLVEEGWIERQPGKGTFIKKEPIKEELGKLTGFFEEMTNKGFVPKAEVLDIIEVDVDEALLKKFPEVKLLNEEKVMLIKKLHKINDKKLIYVNSFWKLEYGKELAKYDLSNTGVYEIADRFLNVQLTKAEETISAKAASKEEATLLDIKKGEPVLLMERLSYQDNVPIEYAYNVYRADRYRYNITLHKNQINKEIVIG